MRICLYWNHTAGGGLSLDRLTEVIQGAGHTVVRAIDDESDLPEDVGDVECVVVAGGDGTVARAGCALAGGTMPLAILPLGTANNIAGSLDIRGEIAELVSRWHESRPVRIDVGVATIKGTASLFLESVGFGLVTSCIDEGRATLSKDDPDAHLADARMLYLETLARLAPRHYDLTIDGERLSGEFLLVEALNTPSIGPQLEFSAGANAADGFLSVVAVTAAERDALVAYVTTLHAGGAAHADFKSWRASEVVVAGADRAHVDDRVVDAGEPVVAIAIRRAALPILA
jgi:diacylglycerol kinase (ATP)